MQELGCHTQADRSTLRVRQGYDDRPLCSTDLVTVGIFYAVPSHHRFRDSGPIEDATFVFPRTCVTICPEGSPPLAADPRTVVFYNRGQRYTRRPIDPRGDRCDWFAVREDVLREALAPYDPGALDRSEGPFGRTHGLSDARAYAAQRAVVRHVAVSDYDPMAVEEAVLSVLRRVLAVTHDDPDVPADTPAALTQAVRGYLHEHYRESTTLDEVARAVGASPFHMCRVFKQETGTTVHRYRQELRLRRSLELVAESGNGLSKVAFELGFSSHSHFSAAFRRAFGRTPSHFRRHPSRWRIEELARLGPHH